MRNVSYINLDDHINAANIPLIPELARRFLELHGLETIDEQDVLSIEADYPQFFESLLNVINSDHFNLTSKVSSIYQAVQLAGFERICLLMICLVIYKTFGQYKIRGLDQQEFWEDSLRRAVSARMIGETIGLDGSRCFTAGLMQDIGFLLLFLLSPNKGALWAEFRKREPEARYSMERNVFNMTHDQASELFCERWGMLDEIARPICNHHSCNTAQLEFFDEQLCKVLHCADWMSAVYTALDKSFVINRCRQILTENFEMEPYRTEELLAAIPDEVDLTALVLGIKVKGHIEFSQILFQANIKLNEDNINFQELTMRLEQALDERDRLAAELNRDLGLAREIQKSLLPPLMDKKFPIVGINISARDLSGDFYDYFSLPDGRIYFNLGDVSGKGVNAALLMAKTSSLFRCLGKRIHDPGELMSQINIELCETSIHGMFVTMIAGLYCPKSGMLRMVNAGNPPALLFSPDGLARELDAQAPPLGVLSEAEFPEFELDLADQSLYMFSDGVTEGYVAENEMLEMSGLFKTIATMEAGLTPLQRIEKIVDRFNDSTVPFRDDVTLLLLEKQ
ncbi:MAG: SpoIIE family protein phosphatase [Gammaproteobacteria bacterium]|nr:SpoIIE family protein phosphatase [Gammaproteobacteria bacterium]